MADARTAYLEQSKRYHPDRVAHLAPEFRQLADQRMKAINRAFAELTVLLAGDLDPNPPGPRLPRVLQLVAAEHLGPKPASLTVVIARRRVSRVGLGGLVLAIVAGVALLLGGAWGNADALRAAAPPALEPAVLVAETLVPTDVPEADLPQVDAVVAALAAEVERHWNVDWPLVIRELEVLVRHDPGEAAWAEKLYAAHVNAAEELRREGDPMQALFHLERAEALDLGRGVAQQQRGMLQAGR